MKISDMVRDMKTTKRRKLAGDIVAAEFARQRFTREQTADRARTSPSTIDRVRKGDETVRDSTLRQVEGALGLPDNLLIYIANGDTAAIEAIGANEMRPGLRRVIMAGLARIAAEEVEDARPPRTRKKAQ
jgi:transcriptional regulator with XRE-family HTH domain